MVRSSYLQGHSVDDQTAIGHGPHSLGLDGPMWDSKDVIKILMTTTSEYNYSVLKGA